MFVLNKADNQEINSMSENLFNADNTKARSESDAHSKSHQDTYNLSNRVLIDMVASPSKVMLAALFFVPITYTAEDNEKKGKYRETDSVVGRYELSVILPDYGMLILKDSLYFKLPMHASTNQLDVNDSETHADHNSRKEYVKRSCLLWHHDGDKLILLLHDNLYIIRLHFLKARLHGATPSSSTGPPSLMKGSISYQDLLGFISQNAEEVMLRQTLFVAMKVLKHILIQGSQLLELDHRDCQPFYTLQSRFKNNHTDEMHLLVIDRHSYTIVNLDGDIIHSFHKTIDGDVPDMERSLLRIEDEDTYSWKLQYEESNNIQDSEELNDDSIHSLIYSSSSSDVDDNDQNSQLRRQCKRSDSASHQSNTISRSISLGGEKDKVIQKRLNKTADEVEAQSNSTMIHTMTYVHDLQGFIIVYYDGSISIHHYDLKHLMQTSGSHLRHFHSPRTHIVSLVAYPFPLESLHKSLQDNFMATNGSSKDRINSLHPRHPAVYERNTNKDYFSPLLTMREVNNFLLLSESLQRTILRSKLVVTGKSVEEISRVLHCVVVPSKQHHRRDDIKLSRRSSRFGEKEGSNEQRKYAGSRSKTTFDDEDDNETSRNLPFITPSKPPPAYKYHRDDYDELGDIVVEDASVAKIILLLATKHCHNKADNNNPYHKQHMESDDLNNSDKEGNACPEIVSYSLATMNISIGEGIHSAGGIGESRIPSMFNLSELESPSSKSTLFTEDLNCGESSFKLTKSCEIADLQVINIGHSYVKHRADSVDLCHYYSMRHMVFPDHTSCTSSTTGYLLIQHHGVITCRDISNLRISYFACQMFESHPLTDVSYFATFALNRLIVSRSCIAHEGVATKSEEANITIPVIHQNSHCEIALQDILHCPTLCFDAHASNACYYIDERHGSIVSLSSPHDSMMSTRIDNFFGLDRVQQASIQPYISSQSSKDNNNKESCESPTEKPFPEFSSHESPSIPLSLHHMVYNPNSVIQCVTDIQKTIIPLPKALLSAYYAMKFHSTVHYKKYGLYISNSRDRNITLIPSYYKDCHRIITSNILSAGIVHVDEEAVGMKIDESSITDPPSITSNYHVDSAISGNNHDRLSFVKSHDFQSTSSENEYIACVIARNVHYQSNSSSSSIGGRAFGKRGGMVGSKSSAAYHQVKAIADDILPEVWIYSGYTKRWRNIILALADQYGNNNNINAMVIRDIFTMDYSMRFPAAVSIASPTATVEPRARSSTEESVNQKPTSSLYTFTQAHSGSNPLHHPPDVQSTRSHSFDYQQFNTTATSMGGICSNTGISLKSVIHQIMNPTKNKSNFNHNFIQILSLHWFGTHSLILVTIRKSQCYVEILSREPLKDGTGSSSAYPSSGTGGIASSGGNSGLHGHLMSKFHYLIPLPPGFVPIYIDCVNIDHEGNSINSNHLKDDGAAGGPNGVHKRYKGLYTSCVVLVSDGRYYNAYQINARYQNHTVASHLSDYYYRGNYRLNRNQEDDVNPANPVMVDGSASVSQDLSYVSTSVNIIDYSIVELWSYTFTHGNPEKKEEGSGSHEEPTSKNQQTTSSANDFSMYHYLKSMKIFVQSVPINNEQEQAFSNIFSMNQGGLPYQLYFAAMIISDKEDRIFYVDPVHSSVQMISSPSTTMHSMPASSHNHNQWHTNAIHDFQLLHKNQLGLDIINTPNPGNLRCETSLFSPSATPATISSPTSLALCNDLVLLTSKSSHYDVVGNYRACFISLLTKYNLLQKFARKGLKPYHGLMDDPFKKGEKKLPCNANLQRLWFHCYNPLSNRNGKVGASIPNHSTMHCDRITAMSIDIPVYTTNHTMVSLDHSSDPIAPGWKSNHAKISNGVSYGHNVRRHVITSQSFLFQLYMSIAVTLFHLESVSTTSTTTSSVSGPQALLMMLSEQLVFFDPQIALSMTQKCHYLRQWLKLLLDQALSVPKSLHLLELSLETLILSMIPNISSKRCKNKQSTTNRNINGSDKRTGGFSPPSEIKYDQFFRYFIGLLYESNSSIYHEIISRICRKIEYNVCYDIFPLPIQSTDVLGNRFANGFVVTTLDSRKGDNERGIVLDFQQKQHRTLSLQHPSTVQSGAGDGSSGSIASMYNTNISLVDMFEQSMTRQSTWHASRILTLLCEYVGGTESPLSIASCLLLSCELLYQHIVTLSLKKAIECIDFIHRLEESQQRASATTFNSAFGETTSTPRSTISTPNTIHRENSPNDNNHPSISTLIEENNAENDPLKLILNHIIKLRFRLDSSGSVARAPHSSKVSAESSENSERIEHNNSTISEDVKSSIESGEAFFAGFDWILSSLGLISSPVTSKAVKRPAPVNKIRSQENVLVNNGEQISPESSIRNNYHYNIAEKLRRDLSNEELSHLFCLGSWSNSGGNDSTKYSKRQSIVGHILAIALQDWWGFKSTYEYITTQKVNEKSQLEVENKQAQVPASIHTPTASLKQHRHSYASGIFMVLILFANPTTKCCIIDHIRSHIKQESANLLRSLNPKYGLQGGACFHDVDLQTQVEVAFKNILLLFRASKVFSSASCLTINFPPGENPSTDEKLIAAPSTNKKRLDREILHRATVLREFAFALQENVSEQYIRRLMELELHPYGHHPQTSSSFLNLSNHSSSHYPTSGGGGNERDQRRTSRQYSSDSISNAASTLAATLSATNGMLNSSTQPSLTNIASTADPFARSVVYFDLPGSIEDMEVDEDVLDGSALLEGDVDNYDPLQHPLAPFFSQELLRHPRGSHRVVCNDCSVLTSASRHYSIFHVLRSVIVGALLTKNLPLAWFVILQVRHCFPREVIELILSVHSESDIHDQSNGSACEVKMQNVCDLFLEFILQ